MHWLGIWLVWHMATLPPRGALSNRARPAPDCLRMGPRTHLHLLGAQEFMGGSLSPAYIWGSSLSHGLGSFLQSRLNWIEIKGSDWVAGAGGKRGAVLILMWGKASAPRQQWGAQPGVTRDPATLPGGQEATKAGGVGNPRRGLHSNPWVQRKCRQGYSAISCSSEAMAVFLSPETSWARQSPEAGCISCWPSRVRTQGTAVSCWWGQPSTTCVGYRGAGSRWKDD